MGGFDLVIFDCDGVLVDSERLAVRTEAQILSDLGWPLTEADIVERFVGRSAAHMQDEIERHLGRSIDWDAEFETRYRDVFERELVAVPGIVEALMRSPRRRAWRRAGVRRRCGSPWAGPASSIASTAGSSASTRWPGQAGPRHLPVRGRHMGARRTGVPWSRTASRG